MANKYSEKWKDPRWQKKRLEIFERDEWMCQKCYDTEGTLAVHHRYYLQGKDPWDYPDDALVTLCNECHEAETADRPDFERYLLDRLRVDFFADDILELTTGFNKMELTHSHEVVASAIAWAISTPEIQRELVKRFLENDRKSP